MKSDNKNGGQGIVVQLLKMLTTNALVIFLMLQVAVTYWGKVNLIESILLQS
jgi:hypothetical protein